jgi:hypothetical protein
MRPTGRALFQHHQPPHALPEIPTQRVYLRHGSALQAALADPTLLDQSGEEQAVTPVHSRQRSTDVALAPRIQHLTNTGSIECAAAVLDPQLLASNTLEVIHHLRTIHPLERLMCHLSHVREETLAQVAHDLKRGGASGGSDGTYEMLQAAIFWPPSWPPHLPCLRQRHAGIHNPPRGRSLEQQRGSL